MDWLSEVNWVTGVAVPVALGLSSSFGAVGLTKYIDGKRADRSRDAEARDAIQALIFRLDDYSDLLQAQADSHGSWDLGERYDDTKNVIRKGSVEDVEAAFEAARRHFPRLKLNPDEKGLIANRFPDHGDHPVEGAGNFHVRARALEKVLARGLRTAQ